MKRLIRLMRTLALMGVLAWAFGPYFTIGKVHAATLTASSVALSDGRASGTSVSYTIEFSNITTSAIKCIKVVFSTTATGGSTPTGLSTASAVYSAASSDYVPDVETWTADGTTTPGTVVITNATGETPAAAADGTVVITGMTNGSTAETGYFAQFSTWQNENCSGARDSGTGIFIYTTGQAVSLTVDPILQFGIAAVASSELVNGATTTVTTTDGTIPFSTVGTGANAIAAHDLTTTTNAGTGYTAYIRYSAAPSDGGSETIDDVSPGTNATPAAFSAAGVEAFGYTTNDAVLGTGTPARFTDGGNEWAKFTTGNLEVAYNVSEIATDVVRVGYQVGVSGTTAAASYTTTVIITCTPLY